MNFTDNEIKKIETIKQGLEGFALLNEKKQYEDSLKLDMSLGTCDNCDVMKNAAREKVLNAVELLMGKYKTAFITMELMQQLNITKAAFPNYKMDYQHTPMVFKLTPKN